MHKAKLLSTFISVVLLMFGSLFMAGDAFAQSSYVGPFNAARTAVGLGAVSCGACHQSAGGGGPLVANACVSAFAGNHNYTTLAACLKPTPTPTPKPAATPTPKPAATPTPKPVPPPAVVCAAPLLVRDAATNTCVAAPAVVCAAPLQVRDAATNTCVAAPAVVCNSPLQVRDPATNTCVAAPAVVCAAPLLVRDAATNTCVAAPAVVCNSPLQVRDPATNTCVAAPAVVCTAPLQVRDAATNTCVAAPAVVCAAPLLVRDAATNTCVAAPAVVCNSPLQVRDPATNTCVATPAVVCTVPLQVRDAATNTCVAAPAVVCNSPLQVRDPATNTCVTAPAVVCASPLMRSAATNTCVAQPPVVTCALPKKLVNGVCRIPSPVVSKDDDRDDDSKHKIAEHEKGESHVDQSGAVGLATSGVARTDVYAVTCAAGTQNLSVSVMDLPPIKAALVSIQATKGTASSALSTDTVDGNAYHSPLVRLAGGAGVYMVKVNKATSAVIGVETYKAQFSCQNAKGIPTGTKSLIKQNQ
jgi:hypothetical protein